MKNLRLNLTLLMLIITFSIYAHTFSAENSEGVTIYYRVLSSSNKTVAVTFKGTLYNDYNDEYNGIVNIPSTVNNGENSYTVIQIDQSTFENCSNLMSVTLPESVTTIQGYAFKGCSSLLLLKIGNSLTYIGGEAFGGCENLMTISILNEPITYGAITIPGSVTKIGDNVFLGCTSIKSLILKDGNEILNLGVNTHTGDYTGLFTSMNLEYVYLGRNLSYNATYSGGYSPFRNLPNLTSLTIGESVTNLGANIFSKCSSIENINLSKNISTIETKAFSECTNLKTIIFPESLTMVGANAFENCKNIETIYSLSMNPAMVAQTAFNGVDKDIPLYIPQSSKMMYKSMPHWNLFTNFIESDFTGVEENKLSASVVKAIAGNGIEVAEYYGKLRIVNLAGQVVIDLYVNGFAQIELPKGAYIIVTDNNSQKVLL